MPRLHPLAYLYLLYIVGMALVAFWPRKWTPKDGKKTIDLSIDECTAMNPLLQPRRSSNIRGQACADSPPSLESRNPFRELEATWRAECARWLAPAIERIRK
jgi:hypothetical protein